nr:hypothetical protein [Tanacetum cinerariifolium]
MNGQGDQTPPPGYESSDSEFEAEEADNELEVEEAAVEPEAEGADMELEAEERDGAPKATIGTGSQRPFADWKNEREILHHDLSDVEETLGNMVERLKVLESGENATLKKKLADKEMLLDLTSMDRDKAERRLSKSIWIMPPKAMSEDESYRLEQEMYNLRMKGMDIDGYTNRFHELALLCPIMVEAEAVKVEQYLQGLTKSIRGDRRGNAGAMTNTAPNNNETC